MVSELLVQSYRETMDGLRVSRLAEPPSDEEASALEDIRDIGLGKARALLSVAVSIASALVLSNQDQRDYVEEQMLTRLADLLEEVNEETGAM